MHEPLRLGGLLRAAAYPERIADHEAAAAAWRQPLA